MGNTKEMMYREALNTALFEEMRSDDRVFLLGEGIAERGGSYKVTVDLDVLARKYLLEFLREETDNVCSLTHLFCLT